METTEGFYKLGGGSLLYGPNYVLNVNYELRKENHTNYTYPVDGWYWFDSQAEACEALGCQPPAPVEEPIEGFPGYDTIPMVIGPAPEDDV
jgi:hypothetical protein